MHPLHAAEANSPLLTVRKAKVRIVRLFVFVWQPYLHWHQGGAGVELPQERHRGGRVRVDTASEF